MAKLLISVTEEKLIQVVTGFLVEHDAVARKSHAELREFVAVSWMVAINAFENNHKTLHLTTITMLTGSHSTLLPSRC
jgi:hypothetical protein